ncbi:MAG: FAD-dependent oxidoreductase, partial [Spirochaetia bacterium]
LRCLSCFKSGVPVKPISSLGDARRAIEKRSTTQQTIRVAVIGGGPGGVELSANSSHLMHSLGVTGRDVHLYTGDHPLAGVSPKREEYVERALRTVGVQIHKGQRAEPDDLDADFVFMAWGIRPPEVMQNFGLPLAEDGGILIDSYLRSTGRDNVFAVGDCATMSGDPLDRVGVFAVRMQPVLLENLCRAVEGDGPARELHRFTGTHKYLAGFNLGFGRGMLYRGKWTITGRKAFALKDRIDRGFMKRYQQVVRKNA